MQTAIEQMLFLSARDSSSVVSPPLKFFSAITLSPLQPGQHREPVASHETRIFDSFLTAFDQMERRVLLLGAPGSGKTTTLLQFACSAAYARLEDPNNNPIPIFSSIHRWDHHMPLAQWAQGLLPSEFKDIRLEDQSLLYIFDGLDELGGERPVDGMNTSSEKYDPRLRFLRNLEEQLPDEQVVISCREMDYEHLGERAVLPGAVTLLPLAPKQIEDFLHGRNQSQLWETLSGDDNLLELASTPLLLTLLSLAVGEGKSKVPLASSLLTANEIFDFYIHQRFAHEAVKRKLPYTEKTTRALLGKLAAGMFIQSYDYQSASIVLYSEDIKRIIGNAKLKFILFARSMDFLRESSSSAVQFIHLKFRDYCSVPALEAALQNEDRVVRWRATTALGEIGDAATIPALVATLQDADWQVRLSAVDALGEIGDATAIPALEVARQDGDAEVRLRAVDALGKIGGVAIPALKTALQDADWEVRLRAVDALGEIEDAATIPALEAALRDGNGNVRLRAVDALGEIGDAATIPALEAALQNRDAEVRMRAVDALGKVGGAAIPALVVALQNKDAGWQVRMSAVDALGKIGGAAIPALEVALQDEDAHVSERAEDQIREIGPFKLTHGSQGRV